MATYGNNWCGNHEGKPSFILKDKLINILSSSQDGLPSMENTHYAYGKPKLNHYFYYQFGEYPKNDNI